MPEGDTVWLAGRSLNTALWGRVLTRTDFRIPQLAAIDLSGRSVIEVVSRGKHLLTRIEGGTTLHTHFRMDGTWHIYAAGHPWAGGPNWQVRVVLSNSEWDAVGYRMPVVDLLPTVDEHLAVGHLGPDLLGPDWDPIEALRRLNEDPDRQIGLPLRDQRNLAGLGNLYTTELCFLRGVSPWARVRDVGDLPNMVDLAHRLLEANKHAAAQITTGDSRRGRSHWVFERSGRPCLRCGTPIRVAEQGQPPYQRLTYWCPQCQPGPSPSAEVIQQRRPVGRTRYRP